MPLQKALMKNMMKGNWDDRVQFLKENEEELRTEALTMADFEQALVNVRPSVPPEILKRYEDWMKQQGSG